MGSWIQSSTVTCKGIHAESSEKSLYGMLLPLSVEAGHQLHGQRCCQFCKLRKFALCSVSLVTCKIAKSMSSMMRPTFPWRGCPGPMTLLSLSYGRNSPLKQQSKSQIATFHNLLTVSCDAVLQTMGLGIHHQRFKQSKESPSASIEETLLTVTLADLPLPYGTPSPCSRPGIVRLRHSSSCVTGRCARRGSSSRSAPQYPDKTDFSWPPRNRRRNSSGTRFLKRK